MSNKIRNGLFSIYICLFCLNQFPALFAEEAGPPTAIIQPEFPVIIQPKYPEIIQPKYPEIVQPRLPEYVPPKLPDFVQPSCSPVMPTTPLAIINYPEVERLLINHKWKCVISAGVRERTEISPVYDTHTNWNGVTTSSTRYEKTVYQGVPSLTDVFEFMADHTFTATLYSDEAARNKISGSWRCISSDKVQLISSSYTGESKSGIEITVTENGISNGQFKYSKHPN